MMNYLIIQTSLIKCCWRPIVIEYLTQNLTVRSLYRINVKRVVFLSKDNMVWLIGRLMLNWDLFQDLQQGRHFISSFFTDLQILWIATRHSWSFLILKRRLGRRWEETFLGEVQSRVFMSLQILLPHSPKIRSRDWISLKTFTSDCWSSTDFSHSNKGIFSEYYLHFKHSNTFSDLDSSPFQVVDRDWLLLWLQILMFLNQVLLQR